MITEGEDQFPNNVVDLLYTRAGFIDPDLFVIKRPLRATDPNQAIGVFGSNWVPNDESREMLGSGFMQPPLSRYMITVQAVIRDTDEVRGLNVHGILARMLRSMIYTDVPLRVALSSLSSTLGLMTEHTQRWGVQQQRYFANEIRGDWLYLSILELWLETEIR